MKIQECFEQRRSEKRRLSYQVLDTPSRVSFHQSSVFSRDEGALGQFYVVLFGTTKRNLQKTQFQKNHSQLESVRDITESNLAQGSILAVCW